MKRLAIALLVTGCAHHQQTAEAAFDGANKAIAGVGVGVDASKDVVEEATNARMERCADAADRTACMGKLAQPVAPIYEKVGAAYDAAVKALAELEEAYGELAPIIEDASKELGQ